MAGSGTGAASWSKKTSLVKGTAFYWGGDAAAQKAKAAAAAAKAEKFAADLEFGAAKERLTQAIEAGAEPTAEMLRELQGLGWDMRSQLNRVAVDSYRSANPAIATFAGDDSSGAYTTLRSYQGNGYRIRNQNLWGITRGEDGSMPGTTRSTSDLLSLIHSSVAPFDMTVTRKANADHPLYTWADNITVGGAYTSQGFDSSSFRSDVVSFGGNVIVSMRVPGGSHGIHMNAVFPDSKYHPEQEWLLPANSSWVVTEKTTDDNGIIHITVDLVDQRDFSGKVVWP